MVCDDFGVGEARRQAVVADGATNVRKAIIGNFQYVHCTIHKLQLCIEVISNFDEMIDDVWVGVFSIFTIDIVEMRNGTRETEN